MALSTSQLQNTSTNLNSTNSLNLGQSGGSNNNSSILQTLQSLFQIIAKLLKNDAGNNTSGSPANNTGCQNGGASPQSGGLSNADNTNTLGSNGNQNNQKSSESSSPESGKPTKTTFGKTSNEGTSSKTSSDSTKTSSTQTSKTDSTASSTNSTTASNKASDVNFATADTKNAEVVHETIYVGAGQTYDGGGKTYTAGSELGDGGQSESQKPLFVLAEGATLKNVVIGDNGADGIHVKAANSTAVNIDNVHFTNVGEDAITVKGKVNSSYQTNLNITNSTFQNASDKIIQLNSDANVTVNNVKAKDFGTFIRTNGEQQGDWKLNVSNISAENGSFNFIKSDSSTLDVNIGANVNLTNVKNHLNVKSSTEVSGDFS